MPSGNADCPTLPQTVPQDAESSPVRRQSRPAEAETTRPRLPAPLPPRRASRSSAARVPPPPDGAEDPPRYIVQRRVGLHTGVAPACLKGSALLVLTLIDPLNGLQAGLQPYRRDYTEQLLGKAPIHTGATEHDTVGPARLKGPLAAIGRRRAAFAPVAHLQLASAVATAQ